MVDAVDRHAHPQVLTRLVPGPLPAGLDHNGGGVSRFVLDALDFDRRMRAAHAVITGDYASDDRWRPSALAPGTALPPPEALFNRLDPVLEEEPQSS